MGDGGGGGGGEGGKWAEAGERRVLKHFQHP